ncbi:hypothetical protein COO60DRAFT_1648326 [Scenedesmus sp. NREL 46B-D3]|nr:hypothetical protein COO60DRAFT_1648326 [Scenedesmus sp. NREL 46B-D3]
MQLAEKELQVTMLKSFIRDSKDTVAPQQQLTQALQQNVQLLQELHHVVAAQSSTSSTTEPYPIGFDVLPYAAPDQSASLAAHTPTTCEFAPPRMPSTGCSGISTSTSSGWPTAAALSGANIGEEGTPTPLAAEAERGSPSSRCSSPADLAEPQHSSSSSSSSSASKPANSAVAAAAAASTTAGSDDVAATATVDDENVASELSEEEELQHGCVYGDQGWGSSADAPVMDNPLFLLGSPASSPQRARPAVSL